MMYSQQQQFLAAQARAEAEASLRRDLERERILDAPTPSQTSQTFLALSSTDRDKLTWPTASEYNLSIPRLTGVSSIRLGSFEMQAAPDYTVEKDVSDELHVHEGCVVGSAEDTTATLDGQSPRSSLYENEAVLYWRSSGGILREVFASVPAYDAPCTVSWLPVKSETETVGAWRSNADVTLAGWGLLTNTVVGDDGGFAYGDTAGWGNDGTYTWFEAPAVGDVGGVTKALSGEGFPGTGGTVSVEWGARKDGGGALRLNGSVVDSIAGGGAANEIEFRVTEVAYTNGDTLQVGEADGVAGVIFFRSVTLEALEPDEATVTFTAPHGLRSGFSGRDVWLLGGPFPAYKVASAAEGRGGIATGGVEVISSTVLRVSGLKRTAGAAGGPSFPDSVALLHGEPPTVAQLASELTASFAVSTTGDLSSASVSVAGGRVLVTANFVIGVSGVRFVCSARSTDSSGNPRGLGLPLGFKVSGGASLRASSDRIWTFEVPVGVQPTAVVRAPHGVVDVAGLASGLRERLNSPSTASSVAFGGSALQLGVTDALGQTSAVRLGSGKYTTGTLRTSLESELESAAPGGSPWTVSRDEAADKWTLTSGAGDFTVHFSSYAELTSGWYNGGADVPASPATATALLARALGFAPGVSYYSRDGILASTEPTSTAALLPAFPRFSRLNDAAAHAELAQTEDAGAVRVLRNTYNLSTRDPPTRRLGVGAQRPPSIACDASGVAVGAEYAAVTLVPAAGQYLPRNPPMFAQPGHFASLHRAGGSGVEVGQVLSVSSDASSVVLALHVDAAEALYGPDVAGAAYPVAGFTLAAFDRPVFSLLSEDRSTASGYRARSLYQRLGLSRDVYGIDGYSEMPSTWNTTSAKSVLLEVEVIGAPKPPTRTLVQQGGSTTSCLARIVVRPQGVFHVNSSATQEIRFSEGRYNVDSLRVRLSNEDGTPFDTLGAEHSLTLSVTHQK